MEPELKIVKEATEIIRDVVKVFDFVRKDYSLLNQLLESIEEILGKASKQGPSPKEEEDSSNSPSVLPRTKKRKVEGGDNGDSPAEAAPKVGAEGGETSSAGTESSSNWTNGEQNVSEESKPPEEQVFNIDVLIQLILNNLTPTELKTCRLVNMKWNVTANLILIKNKYLKVTFKLDRSKDVFLLKAATNHKDPPQFLTTFTSFLEPYKQENWKLKFPCHYFTFLAGSLVDSDLQEFLTKCGFIIKHLYLDVSGRNRKPNKCEQFLLKYFRLLLTQQLPNLEVLELDKLPSLWKLEVDLSQLFPEPRVTEGPLIPNLKFLHFNSVPPKKIFFDLLRASGNIEIIEWRDGLDAAISWLMEADRVDLLKSFTLEFSPRSLELYESISAETLQRLRLLKLDIFLEYDYPEEVYISRASQVISRFLRSNSESLVRFVMQPLGSCRGLEFPVMPRLKKIRIVEWTDDNLAFHCQDNIFPLGSKLSEIFPSLYVFESNLIYHFDEYRELSWADIFGASCDDILPTVRELLYSTGPPLICMENFVHMFPNLTKVRLGVLDNFRRFAELLWNMQMLKELEFILEVGENNEGVVMNEYPTIDAALTGFSKETCIELYERSREVDASTLDPLRENCSLLDAKCLRKLHIIFCDSKNAESEDFTIRYISHVSGLFAFRMCPQLRVTLSIFGEVPDLISRLYNGLSPIVPYVDEVTDPQRGPFFAFFP